MNWVNKTAIITVLVLVSGFALIAGTGTNDNNSSGNRGGFISIFGSGGAQEDQGNIVRVGSVEVGGQGGVASVGSYHYRQGYNDAKNGAKRNPPASLFGTKRNHYNEGYDKGLADSGSTEQAGAKTAKNTKVSKFRKQQEQKANNIDNN